MKLQKIKTKVISRITSDRRKTVEEYLKTKNIDFSFFDAADRDSIKREDKTFYFKDFKFPLNLDVSSSDSFRGRGWFKIGEIGCLISHYCLWKQLSTDDADAYLILEDDGKPLFDGNTLKYFIENQPLDGIDLIFCQRNSPNFVNGKRIFSHLTNKIEIVATQQSSFWEIAEGTTGYILTKSGAEKLLKPINDLGFMLPADNYILRCVQKPPIGQAVFGGMNAFLTTNYLQVELNNEIAHTSEIHDKGDNESFVMIDGVKFNM
jgi:glycosyl transferase family 25